MVTRTGETIQERVDFAEVATLGVLFGALLFWLIILAPLVE